MNFEAFILGTGGMMPLPGRNLTSVLLRREGDLFLFDCGEATQISLKKLNLKWKKINSIFISHMHADHVTGLPGMLMLSSQVDRDEPLTIFGPGKIKEFVEANRRILDMYINYEIQVEVVDAPGAIIETDAYEVKAFALNHTKPCYGYSFTEKKRPGVFYPDKAEDLKISRGPLWAKLQSGESIELEHGVIVHPDQVLGEKRSGRKFSYVTDTLYSETIAGNVSNSDLFVCEGMFEEALSDSAKEKRHLTARQAGIIAKNAGGIRRLGLIHYSPRYMDRDLKILLSEAKEEFPDTVLCRDRDCFDITHTD
ncbi:MAG: ribonuclease Z [Spirochaetales bacterium]|nr:ribonuclease Z [Spirochaetales bacterium]